MASDLGVKSIFWTNFMSAWLHSLQIIGTSWNDFYFLRNNPGWLWQRHLWPSTSHWIHPRYQILPIQNQYWKDMLGFFSAMRGIYFSSNCKERLTKQKEWIGSRRRQILAGKRNYASIFCQILEKGVTLYNIEMLYNVILERKGITNIFPSNSEKKIFRESFVAGVYFILSYLIRKEQTWNLSGPSGPAVL